MNLRHVFFTLLLVFTVHLSIQAGTTGKIAGEVKDAQTGEALVGVNILVEGTNRGAVTTIDGSYVILNLPPGEYNLTASLLGYTKQKTTGVKVSVDLTTKVDFKLSSTVLEVGKEVVITAERPVVKKDLTSSEAHVDAAQIKSLPVHEVREVLQIQCDRKLRKEEFLTLWNLNVE